MSSNITLVGKEKHFLWLPVKIQGDSYSFVIAECECDNQTTSPTYVKRKGINKKK